ncbi:helix-turn-helix transcriptional regulator [Fusibacter paucivorans]|uniref:Helix-turn-helix transcriptional regulator n=1 Tax=Fusibacter paucivorans TaxID=76009 RepID=A0ABS5PKK1_9FIRM|nr:helix-turn-helix domain-containing protein [Fusibacter paucivorans]MBS7525659.1 helix-turn-helix transcriptional regulator [Fusibacter paucivorans]
MYQRKIKKEIRCPIENGLEILGGKWRSRVICVLASKEVLRYSELRTEMANISDAVLSNTLKDLMRNGMVKRQQYDEIPPRVEYALTERGMTAVPLLQAIANWSNGYVKAENNLPALCENCDFNGAMKIVSNS